jgi:hypothetical protein
LRQWANKYRMQIERGKEYTGNLPQVPNLREVVGNIFTARRS